MKRILSLGIALVFFGLALAARVGFSADWYEIGRYREYRRSDGTVRGIYYNPCSGDPQAQPIIDGDISGTPAVREQWVCDPVTLQTPDPCMTRVDVEYFDNSVPPQLIKNYYWISQPCGN